jgi:hypothetical protein
MPLADIYSYIATTCFDVRALHFSPWNVFMYFCEMFRIRTITFLYSINRSVFVIWMQCVFYEVGNKIFKSHSDKLYVTKDEAAKVTSCRSIKWKYQ